MPNLLKFKRGTAATIPVGSAAEPLFTTDTYDLYIGKGNGSNQRFQKYIASGTSSQFLKGDGSLDSNSYQTALAFSSPLINTSGTISIPAASGSVNGYLTSTDWTTFNNKQASLTLTTTGTSGAATLVGATLNIPQYQSVITNPVTGTGTLNQIAYWTSTSQIGPLTTATYPSLTELSYVKGVTSAIQTQLNAKEPTITAGTSLQYYRGDKTFQTLNTAAVPESGSIYFTEPRVLATVLTGLNLSGGGTIAATDSIITAFGKIQNQISGIAGGVSYQTTWNASTNTPTLTSSVGTKGYYYVVSVAGSTNLNGITDWKVGDWAIFNGTVWDKVDNTDAVSSVNGFIGAVNLGLGDISNVTLSSPTNTQLLRFNGTSSKWENWTPTYISGNQTITLSGDVSGSGTTAITTTIGALKVTNAMLAGTIDYAKMDATTVPTWNQNTTGSAATLTTPRTLTIGSTGKTFNGSANVTWTLAEIGAFANPMTTLGDIIYGGASGAATRLAGNTVASKRFLTQTGDGTNSAAPSWGTISAGDIPSLSYLPLSGGTLTGALNGTSATFNSSINIRNTSTNSYLQLGNYGVSGSYFDNSTLPNAPSGYMITLAPPSTTNYYGGGIGWSEGTNTAAGINAYDDGAGGALGLSFATGTNTSLVERLKISSTGAATFSNDIIVNGGGWIRPNNIYAFTADAGTTYIQQPSGGNMVFRKSDSTVFLNIANSGAATFTANSTTVELNTASRAVKITGRDNFYGIEYAAGTTTSQSYGPYIKAGTSASDQSLVIDNGTGTVNYFTIRGDGYAYFKGNVGIGETAPNSKLDIVGSSNAASTYGILTLRNSSNGGISLGASSTTYAWIQGNNYGAGTIPLALQANGGSVGIGTTSPATDFQVVRSGSVTGRFTNTATSVNTEIGVTGGLGYVGTQSANAFGIFTSDTERMRITSGGNVGIGTTSPNAKLDVYGGGSDVEIGLTTTAGFAYTQLRFSASGFKAANAYGLGNSITGGGIFLQANATGDIRIGSGTNEAMRITSGGNVGIGTTSPSSALHIQVTDTGVGTKTIVQTLERAGASPSSSSREIGLVFRDANNGTLVGGITGVRANSNGNYYGGLKFYTMTTSGTPATSFADLTAALSIDYASAATFTSSVTATSFFESSDIRLKSNIQDYKSNDILNISAKIYQKDGKTEVGYLAQDLENVLSSAISVRDNGYLDLSYRQVHTAKIAALEAKILELEAKLK